jgi:hypothetical protein
MEKAYTQLFDYLKANTLIPTTPVFQVLGGDTTLQYTILKVGYCKE